MSRRNVFALLATVSALSLVGCKDAWHVSTQQVTGKVTVNGNPPAGAVVQLVSAGEPTDARNSRPIGIVQDDGSYTLRTYEDGDGAPVGEYKFLISWPEDHTQPSFFDRLDHKYDKPETSQFTVSVVSGQAEIAPVAIENAKVTMRPLAKGAAVPDPMVTN